MNEESRVLFTNGMFKEWTRLFHSFKQAAHREREAELHWTTSVRGHLLFWIFPLLRGHLFFAIQCSIVAQPSRKENAIIRVTANSTAPTKCAAGNIWTRWARCAGLTEWPLAEHGPTVSRFMCHRINDQYYRLIVWLTTTNWYLLYSRKEIKLFQVWAIFGDFSRKSVIRMQKPSL